MVTNSPAVEPDRLPKSQVPTTSPDILGLAASGTGSCQPAATGGAVCKKKAVSASKPGPGPGGVSVGAPVQTGTATGSSAAPEANNPEALMGNNVFGNNVGTEEEASGDADRPEVPVFYADILKELALHERELGGVRNFRGRPRIEKKVTADDFRRSYTDYEYIHLTILGFAQLHMHCEEIVKRNNGRVFKDNPGVQLLEQRCGMTMHGDRAGANHLLRSAPASLVEAFALAKCDRRGMKRFFKEAFDRTADPCLEGRVSRLMEYLDARRQEADGSLAHSPPWDDVSLRLPGPSAPPREIVGEHLRVFVNECTWRWSQEKGMDYATAKEKRMTDDNSNEFSRLYNASAFEVAMLARGVAGDASARQWEVQTEGSKWMQYNDEQNEVLERARLMGLQQCEVRVGSWMYEIDMRRLVQINRKTRKDRPIRSTEVSAKRLQGRLAVDELKAAIEYFVALQTLPAGPGESASSTAAADVACRGGEAAMPHSPMDQAAQLPGATLSDAPKNQSGTNSL